MDVIRTELLRIADDISLALQNAARSFAFYSDGRDLVRLRETESGLLGEFPDHADEGWPALAFQLPSDAAFQRASSGLLTRNAFFTSANSVADLERRFTESGLTVRHRSGSGLLRCAPCDVRRSTPGDIECAAETPFRSECAPGRERSERIGWDAVD